MSLLLTDHLLQDTLKLLEKCSCHRNKSLETIFKVKQDVARSHDGHLIERPVRGPEWFLAPGHEPGQP